MDDRRPGYVPATGVVVSYPKLSTDPDPKFDNPTFATKVTEPARNWKDQNYFVAIARSEMNKNSKLIQNPGY